MYFRLDEGIYMVGGGKGGPGISHQKDCNVYLIRDGANALLIDGGVEHAKIAEEVGYALAAGEYP